MAGYDWTKGMSNNAVNAYENGEKPISKWSKSELETVLESFGFDNNILKLKKSDLADILLERTSWHHTSKFFNETDFYSVVEDLTSEEIDYEIWKIKNPEEYEISRNAYFADEKAKEKAMLDEIKNNMKIGDLYVDFSITRGIEVIYKIIDINEYSIRCQVVWHYRSIKKFEQEIYNDNLIYLKPLDLINMEFNESEFDKLEYDLIKQNKIKKEFNYKVGDVVAAKAVYRIESINDGKVVLAFVKAIEEGRFVKQFETTKENIANFWSKYENQN